jgi:hypothetical protein
LRLRQNEAFFKGLLSFLTYQRKHTIYLKICAPVAQGIERQPPELEAAGSNPAGRTNLRK